MKYTRSSLAVLLIAHSFFPVCAMSSATTCVALPPLKPVHRICGVVLFPSGDPAVNATVTVIQADKSVAEQQTNDVGRFSFEGLKAGKYELRIRPTEAVSAASASIVLVRPKSKPRQQISVTLGLQGCPSFALVDPKFNSESR